MRGLSEGPFAQGTLFGFLHHEALDDGLFRCTARGGLGALTRALVEAATAAGVEIRCAVPGPLRVAVDEMPEVESASLGIWVAGRLGVGDLPPTLIGALRLSFSDGFVSAARKAAGVLLVTVGLYGGIAWLLAPKVRARPPLPSAPGNTHLTHSR